MRRAACGGLAALGLLVLLSSAGARAQDALRLTVQPGDTADRLAREVLRHPQDWRQVARLNGLQPPHVLRPGQVLRVPVALLRQRPAPATVQAATGEVGLLPPHAQVLRDLRPQRPGDRTVAEAPMQTLAVGQTIPEGAHIAIGPRSSAVLQLADGSLVKLLPDSVASLSASRVAGARAQAVSAPVSGVASGAPATAATAHDGWFVGTMRLLRGSMEVLAAKALRAKPLEVQTPTTVLGVRGTHYRVHVDAQPASAVAAPPAGASGVERPESAWQWLTIAEVLEGRVAAGADTVLGAGQGARVGPLSRPAVSALPPAPDLSALPARFERPLVSWSAPADGDVRVQLARDAQFHAIVLDQRVAAGQPVRADGLPDGIWHVRMRQVDATGVAGLDAQGRFELDARPEPPALVSPRPAGKQSVGSVTFAWAQPLGVQGYALEVARDAAFTQRVALVDAVSADSHSLPLPEPGRYHWRVRSIADGEGRGPWGEAQMVELRPDPLPPQSRHDTDGSLVLTWAAVPPAEGEPASAPLRWQAELAADPAFEQILARVDLDQPQWRLPPPRWGRAVGAGVAAEGAAYFRYRTIEPDGYVSRPSQAMRVDLPRDARSPWLLLAPMLFAL